MGILLSCCQGGTAESERLTPDIANRRQQQAEAAERRLKEQEGRGVKDPERLKEKQKRLEELEKKQSMAQAGGEGGLKWTVS